MFLKEAAVKRGRQSVTDGHARYSKISWIEKAEQAR